MTVATLGHMAEVDAHWYMAAVQQNLANQLWQEHLS